MRAIITADFDPGPIDLLLMNGTRTRIVPPYGEQLSGIAQIELVAWCAKRARYCIPTIQLVEWIQAKIGGRDAIEIGSGFGDLARALNIQATDSYVQTTPELRAYYKMLGQATVEPPPWVMKAEALEAVAKFRPRVVIGAWITQLYREGDSEGSMYGVDEEALLSQVETYIHVGNLDVHGKKRILRLKHETHALPFLFSRGFDRSRNVVHVWNR